MGGPGSGRKSGGGGRRTNYYMKAPARRGDFSHAYSRRQAKNIARKLNRKTSQSNKEFFGTSTVKSSFVKRTGRVR